MDTTPSPSNHLPFEEETIDIRKYLFLILSNWYWFALSIFVGLFVAYLVNRYSEKVYSVQSSLIIRDDESSRGFTGAENLIQGLRLVKSTKSIQNEIGVLKSYSLAYKTLLKLDDFDITYVGVGRRGVVKKELYTKAPFKVYLDSTKNNLWGYPVYIKILSNEKYQIEIDDNYGIKKELKWGEPFYSEPFNFTLKLRNRELISKYPIGSEFYFYMNGINSLANVYKNKVAIDLNDKKGSILVMTTSGFVPEKEADYLNALMRSYIQMGLDEKNRIADNTINFIDSQLDNMTDSLHKAEMRLQEFRKNNRVIDISSEGKNFYDRINGFEVDKASSELKARYFLYLKQYFNDKTESSDSIKTIEQSNKELQANSKVSEVRKNGSDIHNEIENLKNGGDDSDFKVNYYKYLTQYLYDKKDLKDIVAPSAMGVDDAQLSGLISDLSKAYIDLETIMLTTKPSTPGLGVYTLKIETLKKTLKEKVKSLIEVNAVKLDELNRRMVDLEKDMSKIPENERLLIGFEREFNMINKMYTYLNEKRAEAAIAKASNIADNKILDYARPENSSVIKPNSRMIYINGFMAGIMIPLIIILGINFLNTKIIDIKDVQGKTTSPIIGFIGHNSFESELPVSLNPKSTLAESFRGLRTNLGYIMRDADKKVVIVTSAVSGEGKTFFAANLALIIAITGKKVLLVGLDLRKPKINNFFGDSFHNGLSTFLIGKDDFRSIIFKTKYDNLYISPSGPIPPNPAELIGTKKMDDFIVEARKEFDYIIIDTPPIAIVTDTMIAARFADALLFVVRFNYSDKEVLNLIESIKKSEESINIALVVNDYIAKRRYGYGYGIKYGYQNSYGYKYGYSDKTGGYYSEEDKKANPKRTYCKVFWIIANLFLQNEKKTKIRNDIR